MEDRFENIYRELAGSHMTQKELAKTMGISEKSLTNKLYGRTEFNLPEMLNAKRAFPGCTLDYLFGNQPNPTN